MQRAVDDDDDDDDDDDTVCSRDAACAGTSIVRVTSLTASSSTQQ